MSKSPHESPEHKDAFWAFQHMYDLIHEQPDVAFALILEIWTHDQSRPVVQNLSAGPLEDLLTSHGLDMIAVLNKKQQGIPASESCSVAFGRMQCMVQFGGRSKRFGIDAAGMEFPRKEPNQTANALRAPLTLNVRRKAPSLWKTESYA